MTAGELPKILLVTLEFPPDRGGVSRYYGEIVRHWQGEISILKPHFWRFWPHWLPLLWQVGRRVRKEKIEMLWVGQVLPLGYVALWLKRRRKISYVVFTHGMDILLPQKSWWKKMWLKKILGEADLVVANSEFTKGEIIKLGVKERRTQVVYPCPTDFIVCQSDSPPIRGSQRGSLDSTQPPLIGEENPIQSSPRISETKKNKIILSVGRLVKRKGFDKVIEIMPRVLKRVPDVKYVIIGEGPEEEDLKFKIENLKLEKRVFVLEKIDDKELVNWYEASNVFIMPCRQIDGDVEGFGLVFLEAASFGKPVIAGNSGGAPETVHHGYGGYVVDPDSEEELYQALVKLLTDEHFAKRMGEYGREWVAKNFQWEREIGKLVERLKGQKIKRL